MKTLTAIAALAALILLSGCTGAQIKVTPDVPARVSHTPLPNVGIEDSSVVTISAAGDIADAFSKELRNSKFAEDVYYPQRPKDPIDVTLETKFSIIEDTHMGAAMAKAFFTGLTLFLLEPVSGTTSTTACKGRSMSFGTASASSTRPARLMP